MDMSEQEPSWEWGEYFIGTIPASIVFRGNVVGLCDIIESQNDANDTINKTAEVCFIGLVAYFEAFFKDHFASLINICPELLKELKNRRQDVTVDAADLLVLEDNLKHKLGFLLAERYDFGTAKHINSLYHSLLLVTPFSKDEAARYDQILSDRNLLVHHGGTYTMRYFEQRLATESPSSQIFSHSLVVTKGTFLSTLSFLESIVLKTIKATQTALFNYIEAHNILLDEPRETAINYLAAWM